ncbi:MAG: nucleotidyltransferase [Spirochaetia bacterium]|jgi:dTDP-glucose pyrophosphorylase|nr:nucleotidyltransferase [Spirochaetia bacterium]
MKPILVVMAAGMGSRYGGVKQIEPVGLAGETIMDYSVYDALRAGFGKAVLVIRKDIEKDIRGLVGGRLERQIPLSYAYQETDSLPPGFALPPGREKPWGTAHAVLSAAGQVDAPFALVNADDFYGRDAFGLMGRALSSADPAAAAFVMAGYKLRNTLSENGSVSRGLCVCGRDGRLVSIEEHTKIEALPPAPGGPVALSHTPAGDIPLSGEETVSMNMFGFTPRLFPLLEREFRAFLEQRGQDPKAECYIPAVVSALIASGEASVQVLPTSASWFGVTYREDRPAVQTGIRALIQSAEYPAKLWEP